MKYFENMKGLYVFLSFITVLLLLFACAVKQPKQTIVDNKKDVNYIPYYLKVYEADSLYLVGDYKGSYEILDSLFKEKTSYNILNEVNTYLKSAYFLNERESVNLTIKKLIKEFGYQGDLFKEDSLYNIILSSSGINSKEILSWENTYLKNLDYDLLDTINSMMLRDQKFRLKETKDFSSMLKNDSLNAVRLKELLSSSIVPTIREGMGVYIKGREKKSLDIDVLLLHVNDSLRMTYFAPIILKNVKEGRSNPYLYASMVDRSSLHTNGYQVYGTNLFYLENKTIVSHLKNDLEKTNELRNEIGLKKLNINQVKNN